MTVPLLFRVVNLPGSGGASTKPGELQFFVHCLVCQCWWFVGLDEPPATEESEVLFDDRGGLGGGAFPAVHSYEVEASVDGTSEPLRSSSPRAGHSSAGDSWR